MQGWNTIFFYPLRIFNILAGGELKNVISLVM